MGAEIMRDIIMGLRLHIGNIPSTNLHYHFLQNSIYTRGYKYRARIFGVTSLIVTSLRVTSY